MTVNCLKCGKTLQMIESASSLDKKRLRSEYLPFCSERCKLEDLNAWLDAEYKIPVNEQGQENV